MEKSPFLYGKTVTDKQFLNREEDIKLLLSHWRSNINTTIISPRRWGKSSLVRQAAKQYIQESKNIKVCFLDAFSMQNKEEFLKAFATEIIKCTSSVFNDWITTASNFLRSLMPKISFDLSSNSEMTLNFETKEIKKYTEQILDLPEKICKEKKLQIVVCIDEFQNIANYEKSTGFLNLLRSHWQHHQQTTYCFYGSKKHMMTEIFTNSNSAFYNFGSVMQLNKISSEHWSEYIIKNMKDNGKTINKKLSKKIVSLMKRHSYYVQQLSHFVWIFGEERIRESCIEKATYQMLNANSLMYQKDVEKLSSTQINLLKAIVKKEEQFTSTKTMNKYSLGTPQNVLKNKRTLIKNELIDIVNKRVDIIDPGFELWFKYYYMKQAIFK